MKALSSATALLLALGLWPAFAGQVQPLDLPPQPASPVAEPQRAAVLPGGVSTEIPARVLAAAPANQASYAAPVVPVLAAVPAEAPQKRGLAAVFRSVSAAVRAAVSRPAAPEAIPLSQLFDNSVRPKRELVDNLGFDPGRRDGALLSDAHKTNVRVLRVLPDIVVKHAETGAIQRELFARNVIAAFPLFSEQFETLDGAAYRRGFGRSALVMRAAQLRHNLDLTLGEKAALAALHYGLGIGDLNGNGVVRASGHGKTVLLDFEHALTPLREDMKGDELTHPMPHAGGGYYHDMADYRPAIAQWRRIVETRQPRLRELLARSGFSRGESDAAMRTLERNAALMETIIERSVAWINSDFERDGRREGLSPEQLRALSDVNRALLAGRPQARDFVRAYNLEISNPNRWSFFRPRRAALGADEWKDFLDHGGLKALSSRPAGR